ncbi:MAG: family 10 glycosylhydrolase [Bacteroidota bacterium]
MESAFAGSIFSMKQAKCPVLFLILLLLSSVMYAQKIYPKREFRGVWIATVVNIDWPSQNSLGTQKQQEEFIKILEKYGALNFNAVIVQVRAAGDAFYPSSYEPWSKYLTGKEGKTPEPFYDPLKWMIKESHKRGFEFHAWFNPYRATFNLDTASLASNHAFNTHRDWMIRYGKRFYFNPGLPEVIEYTTSVIMEVVNNYDIDAVHFDDYFYPYKIEGEIFQDSKTFADYGVGIEDIEDWRRANVDSLVATISDSIRSLKPWVQFGISPFGVWRNSSVDPNGSDTRAGQTTYDDLYADPLKWAKYRWVDYLVPQLYWSMDHPLASHRKLVRWWADQELDCHLYVGHGMYKVKNNSDKAWNKYGEIPKQIDLVRATPEINGSVFFSAKSLLNRHERLNRLLSKKGYKYSALPPHVPFVDMKIEMPKIKVAEKSKGNVRVEFEDIPPDVRYIITYGAKRELDIGNPKAMTGKYDVDKTSFVIELEPAKVKKLRQLGFTYINRYGIETEAAELKRGQLNFMNTD